MTKAEQKKRTHEAILDSASRLLRNRGISGARVADIMSGAGLTVGGFYAHFASKEALVNEALRRTSKALREHLFARLEHESAADRAVAVLQRYLSGWHRDRHDEHQGETAMYCPFPAIVGEISTTAPEHREVLAEQLEATVHTFQHLLPPGRKLSRRVIALGLIALMYGGLNLARALRGSELSDEILRACRALGTATIRSELGTAASSGPGGHQPLASSSR